VSLVLIGLPASGKSTIAALLARRLGLRHVDSDDWIEAQAGKPVGAIFAEDGEAAFRRLETEAVAAVLALDGAVVSLGGGAVESEANRRALAGHEVVWLDVSVAVATRRAGLGQLRPLLLGDVRRRLETLAAERRPLYAAIANWRVDVGQTSPGAVVREILRLTGRAPAADQEKRGAERTLDPAGATATDQGRRGADRGPVTDRRQPGEDHRAPAADPEARQGQRGGRAPLAAAGTDDCSREEAGHG
jgi:shikimate kinase